MKLIKSTVLYYYIQFGDNNNFDSSDIFLFFIIFLLENSEMFDFIYKSTPTHTQFAKPNLSHLNMNMTFRWCAKQTGQKKDVIVANETSKQNSCDEKDE